MCNLVLGAMPCGVTGSPFLQPSTGWMPDTLGPSNIPPSSMYGNNTLIRSPKWVLPYGGGCWVPSPLWGEVDAGYPSRVNSYLGLALGTHELITDTELHNTPKTSLSVAVLHCRICYLYLSCYRAASVHFRAHMHNMCANPSLLIISPILFFYFKNVAPRTSSTLCVASLSTMDDDVATSTEDEPEDILFEASDIEDGEDGLGEEDDTPASFLSQQRIAELRLAHRRHDKDTGSPEFQVAGMTERISHLTQHLKEHPKDFSTRRGLVALVNKRRRLLNYLYRENEQAYADIVSGLGIRHKVPGAIPSKEDTYGRFPAQKSNKGKSKMKK